MDEPVRRPPPRWTPRGPTALLILAILAWGALAAWGAAWLNQDYRKALIVLGCSLTFLLSWLALLQLGSRRQTRPGAAPDLPAPDLPAEAVPREWNHASLASLATAAGALGCAFWVGRPLVPRQALLALGATLLLAPLSAILAVIGLSDPRRRRGRLAGLGALLLLLAAFALAFLVPATRPLP